MRSIIQYRLAALLITIRKVDAFLITTPMVLKSLDPALLPI
jgi:hypothetical protein